MWRGLTFIGRIQIVKSFAIPKIMSKASLLPVSSELIKEVKMISTQHLSNNGKN